MNASDKMHLLTDSFMYDPIGVALYDSKGRLVEINKVVEDRLSVSDKSSFLINHLFDTDYLSDIQKEQLRKGCVVNESFPIGFTITPSLDATGKKIGYTLLLTGVSSLQRAADKFDRKIEEMEYLVQRMAECVPGTVLFVDKEYRVRKVIANDPDLGVTDEVTGCYIDALPGVLYPGKIAKRILQAVQTCLEGEDTLTLDLPMRRDSGVCLYLKIHMVPVLHKYTIVYLCNQTGMVEAEKENRKLSTRLSERHNMMQLALEKSNVSVFSFNFEKHIACDRIHCKRCFQFYGTTNELLERNKFICRAWTILRQAEDAASFFTLFNRIREQKLVESKVTFRMKNNAGDYRYYEVCGKTQEYDKEGNPKLIIGTVTDVQDQIEYQQSLIRAKEKAESADHMKSAYLANMTHEIRTPLHAIVGFSDLLSIETDPEAREEYMNVIKTNNEMLMGLINDVLDMSKIEANMLTFTLASLNIPLWMQEMYNTVFLRIPPGVELIMDACEPVVLQTDKKRLTQILTNLLTNAIKHTEKGSIRFGYELQADEIRFYVVDTGSGMPEEQLEHIFSRFVQLQGAKQGIGLGLAICKGLVNKMGGAISVTSEEGKGSVFSFTLPRKK